MTTETTEPEVIHEGWLIRQRSFLRGGNSKRFVVLDRNNLRQYKSLEDRKKVSSPMEVTELRKVRSVRKGAKKFTLQLMQFPQKGVSLDFTTLTRVESDVWAHKVESMLQHLRGGYGGGQCSNDNVVHSASGARQSNGRTASTASSAHTGRFKSPSGSALPSPSGSGTFTLSPPRKNPMSPGGSSRLSRTPSTAAPSTAAPSALSAPFSAATSSAAPSTAAPSAGSVAGSLSTSSVSGRWGVGTRVKLGQINRYGVIESLCDDAGKLMVRMEGRGLVLSLSSDVLVSASEDDVGGQNHEAPPPQHLANELAAKRKRSPSQAKVDYVMRNLIVENYALAKKGKDSDETEHECSICCGEYEDGDERLRLPCLHVFHNDCVRPWFRERSECCPVCNLSVVEALSL